MKEFLIPLICVLLLDCILNSLAAWQGLSVSLPPYPYGTRLGEVKASEPAFGCRREESTYPEINFTNGVRPTQFITEINDKGDRSNAEFPLGANN